MKKQFIAVVLALVLIVSLAGCGARVDEEFDIMDEGLEAMGFVVLKDLRVPGSYYRCRLVYDSETCVEYYVSSTYNGGLTLCPRYGSNGEVMIYEGGE